MLVCMYVLYELTFPFIRLLGIDQFELISGLKIETVDPTDYQEKIKKNCVHKSRETP